MTTIHWLSVRHICLLQTITYEADPSHTKLQHTDRSKDTHMQLTSCQFYQKDNSVVQSTLFNKNMPYASHLKLNHIP
jgi:hypothetical protein